MIIETKFWNRVDKIGPMHPTLGRCWVWTGGKNRGYGRLYLGNYKHIYAYRFSWELHFGEIPKGLCILHRCDNPSCVNPDHLFLGTRKDNNEDRHQKGRSGDHKGRKNGRAKLTENEVREIRKLYKRGSSSLGIGSLAIRFSVSYTAIRFVLTGEHWSHV